MTDPKRVAETMSETVEAWPDYKAIATRLLQIALPHTHAANADDQQYLQSAKRILNNGGRTKNIHTVQRELGAAIETLRTLATDTADRDVQTALYAELDALCESSVRLARVPDDDDAADPMRNVSWE